MTRTDLLLLLAAGGLAVAAFIVGRPPPRAQAKSAGGLSLLPPAGTAPLAMNGIDGGSGLASFLSLPDPAGLSLGTRSADGRYVVTQSRDYNSAPQWTLAYLGGQTPGMIT